MVTETSKYSITFPSKRSGTKRLGKTFYELAKKHIVKGKRGGSPKLSEQIDAVLYGKR